MTGAELELPPALDSAVRASAAYVPPLVPDLGGVRSRVRRIRRRRAALRAALAAVVVAALAASYAPLRARLVPDVVDGGLVGSRPIPLWQDRDQPPVTRGTPSGVHVPGSDGEIAAQLVTVGGRNTVVPVDPPAMMTGGTYAGPAPLPDGGLATIGYTGDRARPNDVREVILVQYADHTVFSLKPYPPTTAYESRTMPFTGTTTTLYWWSFERDGQKSRPVLLSYDIASGRLRELRPAVGGNGYELPYFGMQAIGNAIINWPAVGGSTCSADIVDASSGERVSTLRPAIAQCTDVYFALSADGRRAAALVTYRDAGTWTQRVVVVDARTGKIQHEFRTPALARGTDRTKLVTGIDWLDGDTLRYARGSLGAGHPILLRLSL